MKRSLSLWLVTLPLTLAWLMCNNPPASPPPLTSPSSIPATQLPPQENWFRTFGGRLSDQAWTVAGDDEALYFATFQQEPGELFTDLVIYRLDHTGEVVWEIRWGGPFQEKAFILVAQEGVVYLAGTQYLSAALEDADALVLALDAQDGHVLWSHVSGGEGYEEVDGLVIADGDLYITGWTDQGETGMDLLLQRMDAATGTVVWTRTWGLARYDHQDGQIFLDDKYLYLSGLVNGENFFTGGDALVARFDRATGEFVSSQTWGGALFDDGLGLTGAGDSLYVTGLTLSRGNGGQIFLLKYDHHLNLLWEQIWGGPKGESARTVLLASDGNVLVIGHTFGEGAGGKDIVILEYSPEGELLSTQFWGGAGDDDAHGAALVGEWLYIAGQTTSYGAGGSDALLVRLPWPE